MESVQNLFQATKLLTKEVSARHFPHLGGANVVL